MKRRRVSRARNALVVLRTLRLRKCNRSMNARIPLMCNLARWKVTVGRLCLRTRMLNDECVTVDGVGVELGVGAVS